MNSNENVKGTNRLKELGGSGYKIAEGQDDIKGWDVKDGRGNNLGDVDELIFDLESLKVRYMVLEIDKNDDLGLEDRKVLIPIGMAQLDEEENDVILPDIQVAKLRSLPEYDKDNLNNEYETRNYNSLVGPGGVTGAAAGNPEFYNNDHFNDKNLYRTRSRNRTGQTDLTNTSGRIREEETDRDINRSDISDINRSDINRDAGDEASMPVVEEKMSVGKKDVERGGIRITRHIVDSPVEETVNLREEHVSVERKPVDRPATDEDLANAQDQDIEVREHAEVPVINKEARVVEEIKLKKEVTEHEKTIKDTVRKTDVDINKLDRRVEDV